MVDIWTGKETYITDTAIVGASSDRARAAFCLDFENIFQAYFGPDMMFANEVSQIIIILYLLFTLCRLISFAELQNEKFVRRNNWTYGFVST